MLMRLEILLFYYLNQFLLMLMAKANKVIGSPKDERLIFLHKVVMGYYFSNTVTIFIIGL